MYETDFPGVLMVSGEEFYAVPQLADSAEVEPIGPFPTAPEAYAEVLDLERNHLGLPPRPHPGELTHDEFVIPFLRGLDRFGKQTYELGLRPFLAHFGERVVGNVTPFEVAVYLRLYPEGIHLKAPQTMLAMAVDCKILDLNPFPPRYRWPDLD